MDTYWVLGEKEKAVAVAEAYDPDVGRIYRLVHEGRLEEARDALASAPATLREGRGIVRYLIVGDNDAFFDALEAWVESRDRPLTTVVSGPLVNALRTDPRMIAVRERIGLPP